MKGRKASLASLDYLDFEVTGRPPGIPERGGLPSPSPILCFLIGIGGGTPWDSAPSTQPQMPCSVKRLIVVGVAIGWSEFISIESTRI